MCGGEKQNLFPASSLLAGVTAIQMCQKTLAATRAEKGVGKICQGIRNGKITDIFRFHHSFVYESLCVYKGQRETKKKK